MKDKNPDGNVEQWIVEELKEHREILKELQIDMATLKVKNSVWGKLAAQIPFLIVVILWLIKNVTMK